MKGLMIGLTLVLGVVEYASANVECEKKGRYWYPKNQVSKDIAKLLKVKTCTGKRFGKAVKKMGMNSNVISTVSVKESFSKKYKVDLSDI